MATVPNPVTIDEYLATSYSPDREYVDGMILERNMGKGRHSFAQAKLILTLSQQLGSRAIVLPEQRAHVSPERVRIPDICVVEQLEEVTTQPPLLCVEILLPDDHWKPVLAAISDYQLMGVPYVWVVDPYAIRAWIFEVDQPPREALDGKLAAPAFGLELTLTDILP
jgi:Uma2 family endonuclease